MRRYAVAASIAVILTIALTVMGGKRNATVPAGGVYQPPAMTAKTERAGSSRAPGAWAPQIARTAKLSLFVGDPQKAANAIALIAHRYGGQIFALEFASGSGSLPPSAQVQMRVPADRYDASVDAVSAVGKVRDRSESAQDLTGDIADSVARLENLQRTETDMRKIMDRSGSVEQILDVENQLSRVREQIQTLESEMKTIRSQVTYSTIDVSLQTEAGAVPVEAAPASQLTAAWRSAVHALLQTTVALASAVVWMAVFAPYVLVVAVIGALVLRRRARA